MTSVRARVGRAAKVVLLALALTGVHETAAGAQTYYEGWLLVSTNPGSVYCRHANDGYGNQFACSRQSTAGNYVYGIVDFFLPSFCEFAGATNGNSAGTPARLYFRGPTGSPYGCTPNGWSYSYGWWSGAWAEGQNIYNSNYVGESTYYVFPRDPGGANGYGTIVEIW